MYDIKEQDRGGVTGQYRFVVTDSITGKHKRTTPWTTNLIMKGSSTGVDLLTRALSNQLPTGIAITSAEIGTGTTAPADADTALQTPVLTGILLADQDNTVIGVTKLIFFISDADLVDGTYSEFALKAGPHMFARSLISPAFTKSTNEDVNVEYTITINNS